MILKFFLVQVACTDAEGPRQTQSVRFQKQFKAISGLKTWPSKEFGSGLNIKYSVISNTEPADDKFIFQIDIENDSPSPLEYETDENAWEIHFRTVALRISPTKVFITERRHGYVGP